MLRLSLILLAVILAVSCTQKEQVAETEGSFKGERFELVNVLTVDDIKGTLTEDETEIIRLRGEVIEVCQSKGCWMKFEAGDDEELRITFKDYGFFMPMDLAGKEVVVEGVAWMQVTPVAELRHYAEDAGKSEEEIAAITEDKLEMHFEASGVYLP